MTTDALLDAGKLHGILAVARAGSPSAAASKAGVQPSTLYRQIEAAEIEVGSPLFVRRQGVWTPTALGNRLVKIAAELENRLRDFGLAAAAQDGRAAGLLRVTVSDAQAHYYLAARLNAFYAEHPDLSVELLITNRRLDLANGEADIALRPHSQPGDGLVGRRVGRMTHAVYGAESYLVGKPLPRTADDLTGHRLLAYGRELSHFSAAQWTTQMLRSNTAAARFNTVTGLARAVEGGLGLAVLPCFVGHQLHKTRMLFAADNGLPSDIWLLCHEQQRRAKKVTAFLRHFAGAIKADANLFEGRADKLAS